MQSRKTWGALGRRSSASMAKNSVRRTQATVQREDQVGMLREEHIIIDNNPMPTAEELLKYKDISPDLVQYFMKITDEERSIRHEVTRQSIELTQMDSKRRHRERILGLVFAFMTILVFLGITAYALYLDKPWLAGIFSTLSIAGIISAFIQGHKEG